MKKALVVLSGGQDSTTCLFWAKQNYDEVHAITFDYGQRHDIELEAAAKIAKMAGIRHEVLDVTGLLKSASPLMRGNGDVQEYDQYQDIKRTKDKPVEDTFIPMRNAIFINLAANYALANGLSGIVLGVSEVDDAGYPDCSGDFIQKQQAAINAALGTDGFQIYTPLLRNTKADTVRLAQSLDGCMEALAHSVTCYNGQVPPCGRCHSCVLREHGFNEAGVSDPALESKQ